MHSPFSTVSEKLRAIYSHVTVADMHSTANHTQSNVKSVSCDSSIAIPADTTTEESPETSKQESRDKVLFLDGVRGAAAMLVICEHVKYMEGHAIGGVAVHTFFVLSAFLLTMILEKKFQALYQHGASPRRWALALSDYAIRRLLRVYPLVLVIGVVLQFCTDQHKQQWYNFAHNKYNYNFLRLLVFDEGHHFYVFWTLPHELTYYIVIPIFVGVTVRLRRWWWILMIPLTIWIFYFGLYVFVKATSSLWRHLPEFVAGSIGAVVYNRLHEWIQKTQFTFRLWHRIVILVIEAVVVLLMISVMFDALIFDAKWLGPYPFRMKGGDHFICVHVVVLIVLEMVCPGPISAFFEWSLLRYAGKVSFSMYLLHPRIIFSDFIKAQDNYYTKYFSVWVLVFFWSTVSYHAIEYPGQRLAGFIGKKIKAMDDKEVEKEKEMAADYITLPGI